MPEEVKSQPLTDRVSELWCSLMHDSPAWPIHGQYQCRTCGRNYPVPWDNAPVRPAPSVHMTMTAGGHSRVPSWRSAWLPVLILASVLPASTIRASESTLMESRSGAGMAFARYISGLDTPNAWTRETIDIDASLPKLQKRGRLHAIRRLLPIGKPEYQVLEITGDQTVKQQVIVRYLTAEARAAAMPASSVAITPTNYKFRYAASIATGGSVIYIFQITPRKKNEGLMKGQLWIDGETGVAVRQSGYLVKQPSIFIKRVDVTREIALRNGLAEARVTHLSLDTRLVGRAELTIHERPCPTSGDSELSMGER